MASRYFLKVKDVAPETADAVTITFWHPLSEVIRYQPGQFLTFLVNVNGEKMRRSYSMASSPHVDASLSVTVKRLPGGQVSNYLADHVKTDSILESLEPMGVFTPALSPANEKLYVLIGAGSGITPLFSMLKSILHVEPKSRIWLIYGNRNQASIIYKDHLDAIAQVHANRVRIIHVLSQPTAGWEGPVGRVNQHLLTQTLNELTPADRQTLQAYMCGPDGLMDEARQALALLAVPVENIHRESYGTATTDSAVGVVVEDPATGEVGPPEVTVLYEGSEYKFTVEPHQTILEAALEMDIDLPYSCQAGMCTACLGKCVAGTVTLDEEEGLSPAELKAGYVLTCVAHPASAGVVIEID